MKVGIFTESDNDPNATSRKLKENEKKGEEVIPEFQMAYIPVGGGSEWLILNLSDKEVKFDLLTFGIDCVIPCLTLIVFLQWRFFRLQIDEDGFAIFFNSILSFFATLICRIITIIRSILVENPDIPISFDKFIFNIYYCPFLWILTVYLCDWTPVKAWIQKKVKENENKEVEMIPEFQMAHIPVGGAGGQRRNREEETVISYLSVSDVSVVL
ncbi:unnamed protein product [Caenorhabditis brenneri]